MAEQRPAYFRPALMVGAAAGLLSGLPVLSIGNCFCCLWIIGGGALAVRLLAKQTPATLTPGDGALTGTLTGIVAAVVQAVVSLPFRSFNPEQAQRILDWLTRVGVPVPPGTVEQASRMSSTFSSTGGFLLSLLVFSLVMGVVGCLGGLIGVSLFGKKTLRPSAVPPGPAVPPPPPPSGPSDAA